MQRVQGRQRRSYRLDVRSARRLTCQSTVGDPRASVSSRMWNPLRVRVTQHERRVEKMRSAA